MFFPVRRRCRSHPPAVSLGPFKGGTLAALAASLLAGTIPTACGERRDRERLAALEAGIASAKASLSALPAAADSPPAPPRLVATPARTFPAGAPARLPAGARPLTAADLLGAEPDALRRWFGDPDLRRPEGGADVLLFLGPGCALDVVLYAAPAGAKRVAHAAARADGPAAVTEADCLRGIGGGRGGVGRAEAAGHTPRR